MNAYQKMGAKTIGGASETGSVMTGAEVMAEEEVFTETSGLKSNLPSAGGIPETGIPLLVAELCGSDVLLCCIKKLRQNCNACSHA